MRLLIAALNLYVWGLTIAIIFFLLLIAKFFQEKAGIRSYYELFIIPIGMFILGALQYAWHAHQLVGEVSGDIFFFCGGVALVLLGSYLRWLMVGKRK